MESYLRQPHAVLVPGPALGHVNGCLLLANSLLSVGFSVTLACFTRSYSYHASKGRINLPDPSLVRLEVVPDGLPPEVANYHDLFRAHPAMHDNLLQLLRKLATEHHPATCLISDTMMAWPAQDVADEVGIPRVEYWTATATSYLTILAVPDLMAQGLIGCHKGPRPLSWKSEHPIFVDCVPGWPGFPLDEVLTDLRFAESCEGFHVFINAAHRVKRADCVFIHTVEQLEKEAFEALQRAGIDAYAIGPLVYQSDDANSAPNDPALTWLHSRAPSSVIYVSYGSNEMMTAHEISELALGLEASGQAFLWVIRSGSIEQGGELDDVLPRGFQQRTAERGLIMPWVSQMAVLKHPAVGGFLSHCGWNSTLESLWMGVPILAHPRRAEQPLNSRLIVQDWGTGIELETDDEGAFSRTHVEKGVRALLEGEPGRIARFKSGELSQVVRKAPFAEGPSHLNLLKFATRMKERCLQIKS